MTVATVHGRICSNGICQRLYDGAEDFMFCYSNVTAIGYEVVWEFVECGATGMSFSSFVELVNNRYKRSGYSKSQFVTAKTFIHCWFAWSSSMDIDFRKQCEHCPPGSAKILACDGTKIGTKQNNFIGKPIETSTDEIIPVNGKRYDRTFFTNTAAGSVQKRKEIQKSAKQLAYLHLKKSNGLWIIFHRYDQKIRVSNGLIHFITKDYINYIFFLLN